jgi:hypothetical protein
MRDGRWGRESLLTNVREDGINIHRANADNLISPSVSIVVRVWIWIRRPVHGDIQRMVLMEVAARRVIELSSAACIED